MPTKTSQGLGRVQAPIRMPLAPLPVVSDPGNTPMGSGTGHVPRSRLWWTAPGSGDLLTPTGHLNVPENNPIGDSHRYDPNDRWSQPSLLGMIGRGTSRGDMEKIITEDSVRGVQSLQGLGSRLGDMASRTYGSISQWMPDFLKRGSAMSLSMLRVTAMNAELADMPDEKIAGIMDIIRQNPEISGAVAGGGLGALAGGLTAEEEEDKRMRAVLGGLMGAAAGAGLGHLAGSPSSAPSPTPKPASAPPGPEQKVEGSPVAPTAPSSSSAGAVTPASEVESRLRSSGQQAQQQAEQAMTQQLVQDAATQERAALLKDQGRVQARVQRLLAPQGPPSQNAVAGGPRNLVLGPGVQRAGRFGMKAPSPDGGAKKTAALPRMKAPAPRETMPETQRADVQAPAGIVEVPS